MSFNIVRRSNTQKGFTLLEMLLVIAIIAILAAIVIVAINPARQLAQARNAQRASDLNALHKAVQQYYIDEREWPADGNNTLDDTLQSICGTGVNTGCIDLEAALVPTYIPAMPVNPSGGGYQIALTSNGKLELAAQGSGEQDLNPVVIGTTTAVVTVGDGGDDDDDEPGWYLVFKSSDPSVWNTDVGSYGDNEYSLAATNIPSDMTQLKLVWGDNEKIVDLTQDDLLSCVDVSEGLYWNGTLDDTFGGLHLGITDSGITQFEEPDVLSGYPCMNDRGSWGFGHVAYQNDQGFGWNGIDTNVDPLPVLEIYVYTSTPIP